MNGLLNIIDCSELQHDAVTSPYKLMSISPPARLASIELGPMVKSAAQNLPKHDAELSALVTSKNDFEALSSTAVDKISVLLSASDTHSMMVLKRNKMKQLRHLDELCEFARESSLPVRCYLMCAFSCPFEGELLPLELSERCARLIRFGCEEVILVDSDARCDRDTLTTLLNVLSPQLPKSRTGFYFSADNPNHSELIQSLVNQGFERFCASQNGSPVIGSENLSSIKIEDLLNDLTQKNQ